MKEYLPLMRRNLLFDRIDEEDLIKTLTCLNMQIMQCEKGNVILHQLSHVNADVSAPDHLTKMLPGSILLVHHSEDGTSHDRLVG